MFSVTKPAISEVSMAIDKLCDRTGDTNTSEIPSTLYKANRFLRPQEIDPIHF